MRPAPRPELTNAGDVQACCDSWVRRQEVVGTFVGPARKQNPTNSDVSLFLPISPTQKGSHIVQAGLELKMTLRMALSS